MAGSGVQPKVGPASPAAGDNVDPAPELVSAWSAFAIAQLGSVQRRLGSARRFNSDESIRDILAQSGCRVPPLCSPLCLFTAYLAGADAVVVSGGLGRPSGDLGGASGELSMLKD